MSNSYYVITHKLFNTIYSEEYNNKRVNCYIRFFLKYMAGDGSVVECYTQGGYNE